MKQSISIVVQSIIAFYFFQQPMLSSAWQAEGRYSFSLTTFDPTGKLGQVERAMEAAAQGTPIVGIISNATIFMAAPQILPSPLMQDDGTRRFSQVTDEICIAHSGIAADGRVLVAEAHRIAVEYQYTFDEPVPLQYLLEELAQVFQQYTMKPGARPFGSSLLIGYSPKHRSVDDVPCFYRLDPSGAIITLGMCAVVHGDLARTDVRERLQQVVSEGKFERETIADILHTTLVDQALKKGQGEDVAVSKRVTILTAKAVEGHFSVRRHSVDL